MTARPDAVSERRLVSRAVEGDIAAFDELVRRHQDEAYSLALRLLADPDLASDVVQESLIRAWRGLAGFRGDSSFSTWLHRITVNTAWSLRRRARRHRSEEVDEATPGLTATDSDHPERAGEMVDLRRRLVAALDRLPTGARTVVVLKDVHGWSHAEIADALDISLTAAKVRLHRARLRLQQELEGSL